MEPTDPDPHAKRAMEPSHPFSYSISDAALIHDVRRVAEVAPHRSFIALDEIYLGVEWKPQLTCQTDAG